MKKLAIAVILMTMMVMAFAGTAFAATSLNPGDNTVTAPVIHSVDSKERKKVTFTAPETGIYTFKIESETGADITASFKPENRTSSLPVHAASETGKRTAVRLSFFMKKGQKDTYSICCDGTKCDSSWKKLDTTDYTVSVNLAVGAADAGQMYWDSAQNAFVYGNCIIDTRVKGTKKVYNPGKAIYPCYFTGSIKIDDGLNIENYPLNISGYSLCKTNGNLFSGYGLYVGSGKAKIKFNDSSMAACLGYNVHTENYVGKYKIVPKKAVIKSVAAGTGKVTVTAKNSVSYTGGSRYKIAYRVKGTKTWKYVTTASQKKTIKNLKKGKVYQIKIKAYKKIDGSTYSGKWSLIKTSARVK